MIGRRKRTVLNIEILDTDLPSFLKDFTAGSVFTANIDHLVLLQEDEEFYRAYSASEHVVLDSRVLFLLYKFLRRPFRGVVHGADLLPAFCRFHQHDADVRLFLCGGTVDGIQRLRDSVNASAGRELVVGSYAPPFGFENDASETQKMTDLIRLSGATALAIGVGTPKQEKWLHVHRNAMPSVRMFLAIGAGIDFMTGAQQRAPLWVRTAGLEWFYRLVRAPRRLATRYLIRDMRFFYYLTRSIFNRYKNPFSQSGPIE